MKTKVNMRCVICGEARSVELAHIESRGQGCKEAISLCANHHKAYDNGLLYLGEIRRLPPRAYSYYMEKYGKGLSDAELGVIEGTLDKMGFIGEYRQGYRDAMRDFMLTFKSPEFANMLEEGAKATIQKFLGRLNT